MMEIKVKPMPGLTNSMALKQTVERNSATAGRYG
jgi:hypothetical protein